MTKYEESDIDEIISDFDWKRMSYQNVLVTGATGAMARYVVHVLMKIKGMTNNDNSKVFVLCRNEEKAKNCFSFWLENPRFKIVYGTVENPVFIEDNVDYIFHAAGLSSSKYFKSNPVEILNANTVGTYQILELAKKKKVKGFLFFSSCAVTGKLIDDYYKYTTVDFTNSSNCYIIGKRVGESLCSAYYDEYEVPAKIVRIGYSFGPYVDLNDGHLFSDFMKSIINHQNLVIKGDGQNHLGLCYVTDAVRAFFKIILDGESNVPYVMRNQIEVHTIAEIARILTKEVFSERKLEYICNIQGGGQEKFEPIMPKLLMDMGWSPKVSLAEGFKRSVAILENS